MKVSIDCVSFEWVFGLGFDDHEENFITLSNRNFSKLILDQFDRKRQKKVNLLETTQEVLSDCRESTDQRIDTSMTFKGIKKSASKGNELGQSFFGHKRNKSG